MTTIAEAMRSAVAAGLPRQEAHYLMLALLDCSRAWLIAHDDQPLTEEQLTRFRAWLASRLDDVPLAYLVGDKEFFGLRLRVSPDTLIPRPDTETLVAWALERLNAFGDHESPRVVDLGTGSGAIALAIKSQRPDAQVTMVDVSAGALAIARDNALRLGLAVEALAGSWFEPLAGRPPFDLVVSNPPYIAEADPHLDALRHEPRSALTPGGDGLDDLRRLVAGAPAVLRPGGWLLLEHGWDQSDAVAGLLNASGFSEVTHRRDLGGHVRASGGCWQPAPLTPPRPADA